VGVAAEALQRGGGGRGSTSTWWWWPQKQKRGKRSSNVKEREVAAREGERALRMALRGRKKKKRQWQRGRVK